MADSEYLERQREELESIIEIVGSSYVKVKSDGTNPNEPVSYKVRVVPRGGGELTSREQVKIGEVAREEQLTKSIAMDNDNGDYSSVWMHVKYPPEYPDVDPEITLEKIRGVSAAEFQALQRIADENKVTADNFYDVVIYNVWDALRSYLVEHNGNDEIQMARQRPEDQGSVQVHQSIPHRKPAKHLRGREDGENDNDNDGGGGDTLYVVPGLKDVHLSETDEGMSSMSTSTSVSPDMSSSASISSSMSSVDSKRRTMAGRRSKKITDKKKGSKVTFKKGQLKINQQMQQSSCNASPTNSFVSVTPSVSPTGLLPLPEFNDYDVVTMINPNTFTVNKY